jgi:hypothetical protein
MRNQLLIASLALAFTTHIAAAQSTKSESESTKSEASRSESTEAVKSDEATEARPRPTKKSTATRHETREQKARRIAKKYGVTW